MGDRSLPETAPHGVTAMIEGGGQRFRGAAILRSRPHPADGAVVLQLGVPDEALGFRPAPGTRYRILVQEPDGGEAIYASPGAWLDRVGSSWWFIVEPG